MPGMEEEYVPDRSGLSYFFYMIAIKYNLWTGLYCLEPWERNIFNVSLIIILSLSIYTSYLFMPGYIASSISMSCAVLDKMGTSLLDTNLTEKLPFCWAEVISTIWTPNIPSILLGDSVETIFQRETRAVCLYWIVEI